MTKTFDPWDWLGITCGGYFPRIDEQIIGVLDTLERTGAVGHVDDMTDFICTLLCNTDAFVFDEKPNELMFVGDDMFPTLAELLYAWRVWCAEVYG